MKLYTKARVVKSNAVEVRFPRLVECQTEDFQFLGNHISVVSDRNDELPQDNTEKNDQEELAKVQLEQEAKAEEIVQEAEKTRAQAEEVLKEAQEEAARLLERARVEAEESCQRLREEVSQQAFQEGHAQGLAQGLQEGMDQGKIEAESMKAEAHNILKLAQRAAQEEWSKVDETLLQLALKVAERILRVHIHENPEQLVQRIRALSLLPEEREGWKLHVSMADYQWLSRVSEEISIPLLEDQTLAAGDCFLECTEGIFDARVEAQLQRCEQLLREELRHDRLA